MNKRRRWLFLGLFLPLLSIILIGAWIWFSQKEPTLDGKPLSEYLLKLNAPHADVRASSLEYVKNHSEVFGPFCLKLLSKETTPIQAWMYRFQKQLAPTQMGRRLGIRSPRLQILIRAMSALAVGAMDLPAPAKIKALKVGLYDADRQTRMESAKSLVALKEASLPILEEAIVDADIGVRNAAIYGMYLLGPEAKPALESLKNLLINEDLSLDPLCFEVFWRIGPESAHTLGQALNTTNAVAKYRLLKAMVPLRRHIYPYQNEFISGLKHADSKVRIESARALMVAGRVYADVVAMLFPLLRDDETEVRLAIVKLLNQRVPFTEPVIQDLLLLLEDDEQEIRRVAASILERMNPQSSDSKKALKDALQSENAYVREVAAKALKIR